MKKQHPLGVLALLLCSLASYSQTLDFRVPTDSIYVGDTLTLVNTSSGFDPGTSYYWEVPPPFINPEDTTVTDSLIYNADSIHYPAHNSCSYQITLVAYNASGTLASHSKELLVYPRPAALAASPNTCQCEMVQNGSFEDFRKPPEAQNFGTLFASEVYHWSDQANHHPLHTGTGGSYGSGSRGHHIGAYYHSPRSPDCANPYTIFSLCMPGNWFGHQYPLNYSSGNDNTYASIQAGMLYNSYYDVSTRSYLISHLICPMTPGEDYSISFYASRSEKSGCAVSHLGAYADTYHPSWSSSPFVYGQKGYTLMKKNSQGLPQSITPQVHHNSFLTDKLNWTQISGQITAGGHEDALYIGAFGNPLDSSHLKQFDANAYHDQRAFYYIDHVSVQIVPRISATPQHLCAGEASVLEVNDGFGSYKWYHGNTLLGITTSNHYTVYPQGQSSYTVEMIKGDCQLTQHITVYASELTARTSGNISGCFGGSIQHIDLGGNPTAQHGQAPYSYRWSQQLASGFNSIISSASNPTVNLSVPGSYTYSVLVSDAMGCTSTASINIELFAENQAPEISGGHSACGDPVKTYTIANYDPGKAYTWTISSGSGNILSQSGNSCTVRWSSIPALPAFAALDVSVSNPDGSCHNSTLHKVYECCQPDTSFTVIADTRYTSHITFAHRSDLAINGEVEFAGGVTFLNCQVVMGPYARIVVKDQRFESYGSHFEMKCNFMSDGIYVEGAGARVIFDNSGLYYALNGLHLDERVHAEITRSTFNNNQYALQVRNYKRSNPFAPMVEFTGEISGNHFNTGAGGYGRLVHPLNQQSSKAAIVIEDVEQITIGDPAKNPNEFRDMLAAIVVTNSGVSIYNNRFSQITDITNTGLFRFAQGVINASYSYGGYDRIKPRALNIGRSGNYSNSFTNCHTAVLAHGPRLQMCGNNIDKCKTGLRLYDFGYHSRIDSNVFASVEEAVLVSKPTGSYRNIRIRENTMPYSTSLRTGIALMNVNSGIGQQAQIANNDIRFMGVQNYKRYGILFQNCDGIKVSSNNIRRGGVAFSNISADWDRMIGIRPVRSKGCQVVDNYLLSMGTSIYTAGDCNLTHFVCNDMILNRYGVYFGPYTNITNQGVLSSWNTLNKWASPVSGHQKLATDTYGTNLNWPGYRNWYYHGTYSAHYVPNPLNFFTTGISTVQNTTPDHYCAPSSSGSGVSTGGGITLNSGTLDLLEDPNLQPEARDFLFEDLLEGEEYLHLLNEFRVYDAEFLYGLLREDTTLIFLGGARDMDYQHFFDSIQQSAIGDFHKVYDLLEEDNVEGAQLVNAAIVPDKAVHENLQRALEIYLRTWAVGDYLLHEDDYNSLFALADQTPYEGGDGVYLARLMINYNPDEHDVAYRVAEGQGRVEAKLQDVHLYPNPAAEKVSISFSGSAESYSGTLQIYSAEGRCLFSKTFTTFEGAVELDISALQNGAYYYRLTAGDQLSKTGKLIVLKQ